MSTQTQTQSPTTERVAAFNTLTRKLGHWTDSRHVEVRARRGHVVIDLRSPHIADGDIEINIDAERSCVKLLVADDTLIDQWDLRFAGRGKVKDMSGTGTETGRRVHLTGTVHNGEIRVARGGVATLFAVFTREFLADARQAHKAGTRPTVHDPSDTHQS